MLTDAPEPYLACGISGAIQHLAGGQAAKHLIAIKRPGRADHRPGAGNDPAGTLRPGSLTGGAVDPLAEQVRVAVVAAVLLDQVH
jgi:hypothetical protein